MKKWMGLVLTFVSLTLCAQDNGVLDGKALKTQRDFQKEKVPGELKPFLKNMMLIPGSTFTAGYHPGDSLQVQRRITISPFYLSSKEVTNAEYREFYYNQVQELGEEKAKVNLPQTVREDYPPQVGPEFDHKQYFMNSAFNDYPVTGVSWNQAKVFCVWYTAVLRKKLDADPLIKEKYPLPDFRLPTEMEWEYAARGGQIGTVLYPWGNTLIGGIKGFTWPANFGEIKDDMGMLIKTMVNDGAIFVAKPALYPANGYGLYDMAGNVNEWVEDVFRPYEAEVNLFRRTNGGKGKEREYLEGDDPTKAIRKDPGYREDDDSLKTGERVIRGGSFMDPPYYLVTSSRRGKTATKGTFDTGFRIAMTCIAN